MIILNFIWYCLKCMFNSFSATFGYVPDNFGIKEGLIGAITFIIILIIGFLILWATGVISFKK